MQGEVRDKKCAFQSSKNIFFTSDLHIGHANIIKYEGRPFCDVESMNGYIVAAWNAVVKPNDIVFILGDILIGGSEVFDRIFTKLNGKKYLIYGNHDYKNIKERYKDQFVEVHNKMYISIDGQPIILNHEPLLCFGGQTTNRVWHLFGHVHTNKTGCHGIDDKRVKLMCTPNMYDVGVDWNDFRPIKFQEIKAKIKRQIAMGMNYIELYEYDNASLAKKFFLYWKSKLVNIFRQFVML